MPSPDSLDHHDALLQPYLRAADEAEADRCLETLLLDHAAPIIRRILNTEALLYPLRGAQRRQQAEDVYGEVMARLTERLRELRADPLDGSIPDFGGYVAVTTYNAAYQVSRKLSQQRANLKDQLRYASERHPALGLWQSREGLFLAGLAEWREGVEALPGARFRERLERKDELARVGLSSASAIKMPLAKLLGALFELAGQPVEFSELVAVVAELRGIKDQPDVPLEEASAVVAQQWAGGQQGVDKTIEQRELLRRAWREICQLPVRQRVAYLLNFKPSRGHTDISMFLFTRTASPEEIAAALEMPLEELAELWPALPLKDALIAKRLGVTQQQVIGLRKSARARLERHLGMMKLAVGAVGWLYTAASHIFNR